MRERLTSLAMRLLSHRFRWSNEAQLQEGIAAVLEQAGEVHRREVVLSQTDRIDFMVGAAPPGVGVEVKIGGPLSDLIRQLARYTKHAEVGGLLVVTTKMQLTRLPLAMDGKPIAPVYLGASSL